MQTANFITVVLCSHNPKEGYLRRVIEALRNQTLPLKDWELMLVDNASDDPLRARYDLSWHPSARHIHVGKLGKTHALLEAIEEAKGEILVIVDDDNVLAIDYLEKVFEIFTENAFLGVVGGIIEGEFEVKPPEWIEPYLLFLAIVNFGEHHFYALSQKHSGYIPPGAGMAIRKKVAEYYAHQIKHDPIRQGLDPVGNQLSRSGDTDMALCSHDLNLASGYYPQLKLVHLIPKNRLDSDYIQRLMEGSEFSGTLLALVRSHIAVQQQPSFWDQQLADLKRLIRNRKAHPMHIKIERARERGRAKAHAYYLSLRSTTVPTTQAQEKLPLKAQEYEQKC